MKERGADTKKKAAQIVGNLASLTDSKDFVPYLDKLLPMVHQVLVDPVPEARATAAKALGTLVERLGEVHFPDLVPGLLRTLKTDTSGVDRQGAAQGLSEVLSGLGMERLEGLLPDIIANARSPRSTVREGFMSLLVYLPATFGSRFQPHLPKIIPPILSGLSDTEEYVREAAMRAGRMVISNYSTKAIDLLLPELENGMFDPGWRIRVRWHSLSLMFTDFHEAILRYTCWRTLVQSIRYLWEGCRTRRRGCCCGGNGRIIPKGFVGGTWTRTQGQNLGGLIPCPPRWSHGGSTILYSNLEGSCPQHSKNR